MAASVVALPAARVAQHDPARTAFKQPATKTSTPAAASAGFTADPDPELDESLAYVAAADHATLLLDEGVPAGPVRQFKLTGPHYTVPLVRLPPLIGDKAVHRLRFILRAGDPILDNGGAVLVADYSVKTGYHRAQELRIEFKYDYVNDASIDLDIAAPGTFAFKIESRLPAETHTTTIPLEPQTTHVVVEPTLTVLGVPLPTLDAIVLQSVVPKWLGPLTTWPAQFKTLGKLNFNLVHFVPMQPRGVSNSPYSLLDQLDVSPDLFEPGKIPPTIDARWTAVAHVLDEIERAGLLAMTDVVWNHTACNSPWLRAHPESGYNLVNSPHLYPAYLLDDALQNYSYRVATGQVPGVDPLLTSADDVAKLLRVFRESAYLEIKLWEFYAMDVPALKEAILPLVASAVPDARFQGVRKLDTHARAQRLREIADASKPFGSQRHARTLDVHLAAAYLATYCAEGCDLIDLPPDHHDAELTAVLDEINLAYYQDYDQDTAAVFNNLANTIKWERVDQGGPQLGRITKSSPFIGTYFTRGFADAVGIENPAAYASLFDKTQVWANNGWIWNANPMIDFASPQSRAYLRREVIQWGDCVKLRYGASRADNPWLWDHMRAYTRQMAKHFHAFRIDNCHSTPRHLAAYLLDEARVVRPHLYVVAELFTGDAAVDRLYAAELGIHSLIREAMQAWDAKELSRLVHRYSGDPVGSFHAAGAGPAVCMATPHHAVDVRAAEPHALFMDCTHDNEPPAQRRSVLDSVANAAVTAMASCAVGSTLGYDWCIPKHLNVVHEARTYPQLDLVQGMHPLRAALGELHRRMALENMSEVYVHHEEPYIIVYRQDPVLHRGVILIARSAFTRPAAGTSPRAPLSPLVLKRTQAKLILAQALEIVAADAPKDPNVIDGVPVRLANQANRVTVSVDAQQNTVVTLDPATPPGTAVLLETWLTNNDQLAKLHDLESLEGTKKSGIADLCAKLSFNELNQLLYRTDSEEREVGGGVYDVPGYGPFAYCGLSGMAAVLRPIMRANDLGHPMCDNLRQGPWMLDYTVDRLKRYITDNKAPLAEVRDWLRDRMALVKTVPNYLVPKYFALVVVTAEGAARRAAADMMGRFVAKSGSFVRNLAMTAVQMLAFVPSASLHPTESKAALAAGLPHFATAHMRCWGRDILIALRGLLLRTGQTQAAKEHIIALGSTIKHGLIPNLLDSGRYPRYNARDAAWWWVQAVQDYVRLVPNGAELLTTVVARRFPSNDQWVHWTDKRAYAEKATVLELVVEVLARHAKGIHFREHNAGPQLDHAMTHDGFQVDAFIDWNRGGFVFGGNAMNCGSWMDKMGDSHKAGNYGIPATPRDGADVDLQALLYNCVAWLDDLHATGTLTTDGVTKPSGEKVSWAAWRAMLEASFEPMFYVPPADDVEAMQKGAPYLDSQVLSTPHVRRGIYKDTLGGSNKWADYQFRPNQFVAMAMAPSLFNPAHARTALDLGLTVLAGPLGMRTLDPADPNYRGHYHNNDDGYDRTTAHGWNYHQGPEWVWQAGYFYQAYLAVHLAAAKSPDEVNAVLHTVHARTAPARVHLARAPYAGLPELTNKDGEECPGSCMTQAWSSASFLELAWMIVQARATRLNRSLTMDAHARRHRRTRAATPEEAMTGVAEVEVETEEDEEDDA
ncbi:hypothetical protein GGF31_000655 [Allomyces arbusculus]|nr:hypothetical protein GGF31_000655 [Allomyces arbusculus]